MKNSARLQKSQAISLEKRPPREVAAENRQKDDVILQRGVECGEKKRKVVDSCWKFDYVVVFFLSVFWILEIYLFILQPGQYFLLINIRTWMKFFVGRHYFLYQRNKLFYHIFSISVFVASLFLQSF